MKLIDILNMISKGELKEGTKVIYDNDIYTYDGDELRRMNGICLCEDTYLSNLNDECKLLEPDHFADVGKMTEKIEELEDPDVLNLPYRTIKFSMDERTIQMYFSEVVRIMKMHNDKLNEVIRRTNNVR